MTEIPDFIAEMTARDNAFRTALAAELPANKAAIFGALDGAGIARVVIAFDGAGDSGAFESTTAMRDNGEEVPLPDTRIGFTAVEYWSADRQSGERALSDAIESLAWSLLEAKHEGWENEDGAFGEIAFEAADRSIHLEVNVRFTESDQHLHSF
jgi:hypothetical protein